MRFPSQVHKEVNMMRRSLMLVIALGLATLGSSIAWSEDSDQAALIKALDGAKLTLWQGIAQVAKGTEVPIEAKYEMVRGKLMLSIYTSAKGFDTAAEDNSFNEYIGDVTTAAWTPKKEVFADLKHIASVGAISRAAVDEQGEHSHDHPEGFGARHGLGC
jgi:hypothetical protein